MRKLKNQTHAVFVGGIVGKLNSLKPCTEQEMHIFANVLIMKEELQREERKGAPQEMEEIQFLFQGCCLIVTLY